MDTTVVVHALTDGALVGPYEVVRFLAAGGMGEIYVARDARLGREVALKVLPATYGADAERLRRFEQEARAAGRLNHPNLLAIYDVGQSGDMPYIVTELLEGQTLRELLRARRLPVSDALEIALQILRGLAAAHDKGIVHRDLKPANVFVTRDGHVKILDFGLAKLLHPEWEKGSEAEETLSMLSTPGMIVGSVGYMSPEQVQGATADLRSDIFSFGAILYEMLTGERAFGGSSSIQVLNAILTGQPDRRALAASDASHELIAIVDRCLAKAPEERFQSARDLIFALELQMHMGSVTTKAMKTLRVAAANPSARRLAVVSGLTISLLAVLLLTTAGPGTQARPVPPQAPPRLRLERLTTTADVGSAGISPDGTFVAYSRPSGVFLRHVPSGSEVQLVTTTSTIGNVRISPDRNFVFYTVGEIESMSLYRVPLLGGAPRKVLDGVSSWCQIAFARDGRIAVVRDAKGESGAWILHPDGSDLRKLASIKDDEFHSCAWSPDSAHLACGATGKLAVIDTATRHLEWRGGFFADHMLWAQEWDEPHSMVASTPMNPSALWRVQISGVDAQRLTNDLSGYRDVSVARESATICATQNNTSYTLWYVPLEDSTHPRLITSGFNTRDGEVGITTLPDGRIVYSSYTSGKSLDIWMCNADGSGRRRLTADDGSDERHPAASPDGKFVVYIKGNRQHAHELWRVDVTGENDRKLSDDGMIASVAPDAKSIYFYRGGGTPVTHLFRMPAEGGDAVQISDRNCYVPEVSPDGQSMLARCTDEGGSHTLLWRLDNEQQKQAFPPSQPNHWSPDGSAYAYVAGREKNIWLRSTTGGSPRQITNFSDFGYNFAWSRDGKALIVPRWQTSTDVVQLTPSPQ